jgi:hypothetical protein
VHQTDLVPGRLPEPRDEYVVLEEAPRRRKERKRAKGGEVYVSGRESLYQRDEDRPGGPTDLSSLGIVSLIPISWFIGFLNLSQLRVLVNVGRTRNLRREGTGRPPGGHFLVVGSCQLLRRHRL